MRDFCFTNEQQLTGFAVALLCSANFADKSPVLVSRGSITYSQHYFQHHILPLHTPWSGEGQFVGKIH